MKRLRLAAFAAALSVLAACGGGGGGSSSVSVGGLVPAPTACPSGYAGTPGSCAIAQSAVGSISPQAIATSAPFPAAGGYNGTITVPAATTGSAPLTITTSITAPAGASALAGLRHTLASTHMPLIYVMLTATGNITLNGTPGLTVSVPVGIAGPYYIAHFENNAWLTIAGPQDAANFPVFAGPISLATGQSIVLVLYTGGGVTTPTPTPGTDVQGKVTDDITGAAIPGALVVISQNTVIAGATPPAAGSSPWPSSTTRPDGTFSVQNVTQSSWTVDFGYVGAGYPIFTNAQWIQVFSTDGHATYHGIWSVPIGTNLGNIGVALPSNSDKAWLAQINYDRAHTGAPLQTTPLTFDSVTLSTARYWAAQVASVPFYGHQCPTGDTTCVPFWLWETQHHSPPSSQNIDLGASNWSGAEAAFMAEVANCPGGDWQSCPYSESTGHFINIMSAMYWAGVGSATGFPPGASSGTTYPYYAENFTNPASGNIQSIRRSLKIH